MFAGITSGPQVILQAQDAFYRLRTAFNDIADIYSWLSAQSDADLGQGQEDALGFTPEQIGFLRGAFADGVALRAFTQGQLPPGTYPQPTAAYPYFANINQIIGPK